MPIADAEYHALAKRLEELRTATEPALTKERSEIQKKLSEILVSRRTTDRFQCHLKVELKAGEWRAWWKQFQSTRRFIITPDGGTK